MIAQGGLKLLLAESKERNQYQMLVTSLKAAEADRQRQNPTPRPSAAASDWCVKLCIAIVWNINLDFIIILLK